MGAIPCSRGKVVLTLLRRGGTAYWLVLLAALWPGFVHAQAGTLLERQVKAAYLYKFAGFVEWPEGSFARFVQPSEVAELVYFLCQPGAAAITGADLAIDLGLSAGK